jgi:hypothetical protein
MPPIFTLKKPSNCLPNSFSRQLSEYRQPLTDNLSPREVMALIIVEHARKPLAIPALSCH